MWLFVDKSPFSLHVKDFSSIFYATFITFFAFFQYNTPMRVDKFLNTTNITKRRAIAEDMCKSKVVSINGVVAKPAKEVKVGDTISIAYLQKSVHYEVLQIPTTKTIPKSMQSSFVKEID